MNASKQRYEPGDLEGVLAGVTRVVAARGRKVLVFEMKATAVTDPDFLKALIGPSGFLRAPAIRRGKTLLVGFHEEAYAETFS